MEELESFYVVCRTIPFGKTAILTTLEHIYSMTEQFYSYVHSQHKTVKNFSTIGDISNSKQTYLFCSTSGWTQSFKLARQLKLLPALSAVFIFEIGSWIYIPDQLDYNSPICASLPSKDKRCMTPNPTIVWVGSLENIFPWAGLETWCSWSLPHE
jgi:hypothetical protein